MKSFHISLFIVVSILMIGFTSCSKDDAASSATPTPGGGGSTNTVPTLFTQKVLIETFTGAGQAQCPDGFVKLDGIVNATNSKAIPVNVHFSDGMEIPQYTTLSTTYAGSNPMMFPSAMINRFPSLSNVMFNRTQWQTNYDVAKNKSAKCGLSINSTVSGSTATINVKCGFNQTLTGAHTLTVYLLENNVKGTGAMYDQRNSYNTTTGHAYYATGDPILNFNHQNVLRKTVSAALGDAISTEKLVAGGLETKTYSVNISAYKTTDLYVVAFITKSGTSATTYEILNVQRAKINSTQEWD